MDRSTIADRNLSDHSTNLVPEISIGTTQLSAPEEAARAGEKEKEGRKAAAEDQARHFTRTGANRMSKGMDQKRKEKKKPAKTPDEKRAAKKAKKAGRTPMRPA
jgi:hypothetical protein